MSGFRRFYYNVFSGFYDLIIRMHSRDEGASLREFLVTSSGMKQGDTVLDICTGTGSVALQASRAVGEESGMVVAVDFSHGMLKKARQKIRIRGLDNVHLVEADVSRLPFRENVFNVVTCSHAMYELKADTRKKGLGEIKRTLKPGGSFYMMEHEVPQKPLVRFLYYVRLTTMGSGENRQFAKDEAAEIGQHLAGINKSLSPTGKSKLISGRKR